MCVRKGTELVFQTWMFSFSMQGGIVCVCVSVFYFLNKICLFLFGLIGRQFRQQQRRPAERDPFLSLRPRLVRLTIRQVLPVGTGELIVLHKSLAYRSSVQKRRPERPKPCGGKEKRIIKKSETSTNIFK